jgi:hypothetical protein
MKSTIARGIAAGLAGTACMTAWQELAARLRRHVEPKMMREDEDPWERAPAPARLAKMVIEAVTGRPVPTERIDLLTNAVHWGYGTSLGTVYALAASRRNPALAGVAFGSGVWALSYATLVPLGLYEWPWKYSAKTIAKDVSYHLVYGLGTASAYAALEARHG